MTWFLQEYISLHWLLGYMAQISEGGEDSMRMSYFSQLWDLHALRQNVVPMLGSLPQRNDANASINL